MKKILILIIVAFVTLNSYSQTTPQFSQKELNLSSYNPAAIGSEINHILKLQYRTQWVGFEGNPTTQALTYNGAVTKSVGLGASLYYDKTGPVRNYGLNLGYAYHLLFQKFNLGLGISASASQYQFNTDEILFHDINDPLVNGSVLKSKIVPDVNAGLFMYNKKFYFGLSTEQMLSSKIKDATATIPALQKYYGMLGVNFTFENQLVLAPHTMVMMNSLSPFQYEVGLRANFPQGFLTDITYRSNDAVTFMLGVYFQKRIMLAYSYDFVYSDIRSYHSGSHELSLIFNLFESSNKTMYDRSGKNKNRRSYWE